MTERGRVVEGEGKVSVREGVEGSVDRLMETGTGASTRVARQEREVGGQFHVCARQSREAVAAGIAFDPRRKASPGRNASVGGWTGEEGEVVPSRTFSQNWRIASVFLAHCRESGERQTFEKGSQKRRSVF